MTTRYYLMGKGVSANLARVIGHEYCYLDHESGAWVPHARVADRVTGQTGEAGTKEMTLDQARKWVKRAVPTIEPLWVGDMDT